MNRTGWFVAGVAFGAGLGLGFLIGHEYRKHELSEEYRESAESLRRVMEREKARSTVELVSDGVVLGQVGHIEVASPELYTESDGTIMTVGLQTGENNYHRAIQAVETGIETFVDGGVNDYGISYIEEEEYFDEGDGREKLQIVIWMDEHNPTFTMGGVPIDDWDKRVGDSILVDFYKLVPPGLEPILYVRNHRTDEDYEVIREIP